MLAQRVTAVLCARCKGRKLLCSLPTCPLLQRFYAQIQVLRSIDGKLVDGSTPPTVIVGERGYPRVPLLIAVPPDIWGEEARTYDDPIGWWGQKSLDDILKLRSSMVTGFISVHVSSDMPQLRRKELDIAAVSLRPVDTEVHLSKTPIPRVVFSDKLKPLSLLAPARDIRLGSNPKVDRALERVSNDDLDAATAILELYRRGVDIYTIQRALSIGLLGHRLRRRLVPTRWAITAVDRALSRYFLSRLYGVDSVNSGRLYFVEYLGNRFWIYISPGKYEIIWIEIWHPSTFYTAECKRPVIVYNVERMSGTPDYMDGGFEAAKFSVLEFLYNVLRRQARVYIVREILPDYYAPVGNWHIRESVRHALHYGEIAKDVNINEVIEIMGTTSQYASKALSEYITSKRSLPLDIFLFKR